MTSQSGNETDEDDLGQERVKPDSNCAKFCDFSCSKISSMISTNKLIPHEMSDLRSDLEKLLLYSASKATWAKHCSAWKLYDEFCQFYNVKFELPVSIGYARAFATWAVSRRKLKNTTVKSYLSSLNVAHTLSGSFSSNLNSDPCVKLAMRGAENIANVNGTCKTDRLPMNIHLLNILRHRISELPWSPFSKQIFWTACTLCFFTSCRMGELVPSQERNFDASTTLLWDNVREINNTEFIMFVPYSKTTGFKGKIVDIFEIKGDKNCPAAAIRKLRKMMREKTDSKSNVPVFSFHSGKNLTKKQINLWLSSLLEDFVDSNHKITGHSFRAGIPSTLACFPDEFPNNVIKTWGMWESNSYKLYIKHEREGKRALFEKIVKCLYD